MTGEEAFVGAVVRPTYPIGDVPPLARWTVTGEDACHWFVQTVDVWSGQVTARVPKRCVTLLAVMQ